MTHTTRTPRLIALLLAVLLAASACSSGSDGEAVAAESDVAPVESADESDGEPAGRDENGYSLDPDCAAAEAANLAIRRDGGWLSSISDESGMVDGLGEPRNFQPLLDAIEALRPFQDLETDGFGTMRETLDGLASDIAAVQEGRFADNAGTAGVVVIGSAVSEICS